MDIFKRPVVIGIFGLALMIAVIWSYFNQRSNTTASESQEQTTQQEETKITNLTNVDPTDFDSVVSNELDLASSRARAVNSGYQLSAVIVELPGDLMPSRGASRYVFSTDKDKQNNWTITISQDSGNFLRSIIPKEDYLGDLVPINAKYWKFNYVTALQIAEKNGGLDWREKNNLSSLKLTLSHTAPNNWLTWTVDYSGVGISLTKVIDANSGKIIEGDNIVKE
jgi:hypothetical protein